MLDVAPVHPEHIQLSAIRAYAGYHPSMGIKKAGH